jgi:putative transposase
MPGKYISFLVHFVWSSARREPTISNEWRERLFGYIGGILEKKDARLICAGGMSDHIHIYASLPSTISLADLVNAMKANSSRWIHENFPNRRTFAWQKGYGAFSVSKSTEHQVIAYISHQEQHHCVRTFQEEFREFLHKHDVEYSEEYLWD